MQVTRRSWLVSLFSDGSRRTRRRRAATRRRLLTQQLEERRYLAGWVRRMKTPNIDNTLGPLDELGYTTPSGEVWPNPDLTRAEQEVTLRHEGVHAFLSAKSGPLVGIRQWLGQAAYDYSAFFQGTEEILAETRATGSLWQGITYAFGGQYATPLYSVGKLTYSMEAVGFGA